MSAGSLCPARRRPSTSSPLDRRKAHLSADRRCSCALALLIAAPYRACIRSAHLLIAAPYRACIRSAHLLIAAPYRSCIRSAHHEIDFKRLLKLPTGLKRWPRLKSLLPGPPWPCRDTYRCTRGSRRVPPTSGSTKCHRKAGPWPDPQPFSANRDDRGRDPSRLRRYRESCRQSRDNLPRRPPLQSIDSADWPWIRRQMRLSNSYAFWSLSDQPCCFPFKSFVCGFVPGVLVILYTRLDFRG